MKAFLICPSERHVVPMLAQSSPLVLCPVLGQSVLERWIEHLVSRGARELFVATADRPHQIRAAVGDGCRWGVRVQVLPWSGPLSVTAGRALFHGKTQGGWMTAPEDFVVLDHLPGLAQRPLFSSYMAWFSALAHCLRHFADGDRLGVRQLEPGVWVGLGARIGRQVQLRPPCWIGQQASLGRGSVVGPLAVIEDRAVVGRGAVVTQSLVGPDTLVGPWTELRHSLAHGDRLVNWRTESCVRVEEAFLLAGLRRPSPRLSPPFRVSQLAQRLRDRLRRRHWRRIPRWRRWGALGGSVPEQSSARRAA